MRHQRAHLCKGLLRGLSCGFRGVLVLRAPRCMFCNALRHGKGRVSATPTHVSCMPCARAHAHCNALQQTATHCNTAYYTDMQQLPRVVCTR